MYLGLLDQQKREIDGGGYCRVCVDRTRFALAPPEDGQDSAATLINLDLIEFPVALAPWGEAHHFALFVDADSGTPTLTWEMSEKRAVPRDARPSIGPAHLRIAMHAYDEG